MNPVETPRLAGPARNLPLFAAVVLAALLCFKSYLSPTFNWDMLAYVGNALDHGQSPADLHREVYDRAAKSLPAPAYESLLLGPEPEYRKVLAASPEAFARTRPLFHQRVLYIWIIRAFARLGFDPFHVSAAVGALAAFATLVIMLGWLRPYVPPWALPLGVLPAFYALGWPEVARLSTPDTMACTFCLFALYLIFERQAAVGAALGLLVAAVFVRTETLILGCMVVGWLALPAAGHLRLPATKALAWVAAFAAAYVTVGHFFPSYTWRLLISYCMISHVPVPVVVNFSAADYVALVGHMLRVALNQPAAMLLLSVWALALAMVWNNAGLRRVRDLLLLIGANLAIRCTIFPALDYRYHLIFVTVTAIAALQVIAIVFAGNSTPEPGIPGTRGR
jgi:hypothetical protein